MAYTKKGRKERKEADQEEEHMAKHSLRVKSVNSVALFRNALVSKIPPKTPRSIQVKMSAQTEAWKNLKHRSRLQNQIGVLLQYSNQILG